MENILISARDICWSSTGQEVLQGVDLDVVRGKTVVIHGQADSGKSLLLRIIAGIEPPDSGTVFYNDIDLINASEQELLEIRKKMVYVFEDGVHMANLVIRENLLLPFKYHYDSFDEKLIMEEVDRYLKFFEIGDVLDERPANISRPILKLLAFIRAAITEPELLIIDNPIFNLELKNKKRVLKFLGQLKENKKTLLITSDSRDLIEKLADELLMLQDGKITSRLERSSGDFDSTLDNLELADLKGV